MPCDHLSDNDLSWTLIQTRSHRSGIACCDCRGHLAISSIGVLSITLRFYRDVSTHHERLQVDHLVGHRWFLESGWSQQPDHTGESPVTTAKQFARYGAI